ncbi:MAG: prephenate dehydratase [Firmicutes bacterium]|nr:prephenate dehydratase [Bacillota bacterium]MCL5040434.1 prephenate dehydratase [Bacillota bacterium]
MKRVAFLGPLGTFTQEALALYYRYRGEAVDPVPYSTVLEVLTWVKEGQVQEGVAPLENSIEGTVNLTLDFLTREKDLEMVGEVVLPIRHFLLVPVNPLLPTRPDLGRIQEVLSHPQALAQCQGFLRENLPKARLVPTNSTAEAAALVAEGWGEVPGPSGGPTTASREQGAGARPGEMPTSPPRRAAIATAVAGQIYGLQVLARDIQDFASNETRFAIVARVPGADRGQPPDPPYQPPGDGEDRLSSPNCSGCPEAAQDGLVADRQDVHQTAKAISGTLAQDTPPGRASGSPAAVAVTSGKGDLARTGRTFKTSLTFSLAGDRPGGLYETLGIFAALGINLTRIESRPAKTGLGKYFFYIDLEGWRGEDRVKVALARLKEITSFFRVIGSYPAWPEGGP